MTTLAELSSSFPGATVPSLQFRGRLLDIAREEAEEVLRAERSSDELIARLGAGLDLARSTIDALEDTWQDIERRVRQTGMAEFDMDTLARAALLLSDSTQTLLMLTDDKGEPLATMTKKEEARLYAIRDRFVKLRRSLNAPLPGLTVESRARLTRGLEEMLRGEGEYVEDVIARIQAGGER
jgi:hypothetical protein